MTLRFTGSEAEPERRRRVLWLVPTVLGVLGTLDGDGRVHLMNVSWVSPAGNDPTRFVLSVETASRSAANLARDPRAALSLLASDQREWGRAFVKPDLAVHVDADGEVVQGARVVRAPSGAPVLADAPAALAGRAEPLADLGDHGLWLLTVAEVAADDALLVGPPSQRNVSILTIQETRMNYGR